MLSFPVVKEKAESKLRQHTIDLSQMAVPIQLAQEKKPSPESTSEAEPSTDYVTAGTTKVRFPHFTSFLVGSVQFRWK